MARNNKRRLGWRAIVSLLICISIAFEWRRSRSHTDMLAYLTPASKLQGLAADRDGVLLFFSGVPFAPERGFSLQGLSIASDEFEPMRQMLFDPSLTVHEKFGFRAVAGQLPLAAALTPSFGVVEVPYWFAVSDDDAAIFGCDCCHTCPLWFNPFSRQNCRQ
jgi:hypothetical protein